MFPVLPKIKIPPGNNRAGANYFNRKRLEVNPVLQAVMLISAAIPFGGRTGTKNECQHRHRCNTNQ